MTLPQNVKDAVESLECEIADPEDCTAWQTIRAHLLSQDAEIERLTRENGTMRRALETLDAIGHKRAELAESRLAAANALLRDMRDGAFNIGGWADAIDEYFQEHLQGSGDEA